MTSTTPHDTFQKFVPGPSFSFAELADVVGIIHQHGQLEPYCLEVACDLFDHAKNHVEQARMFATFDDGKRFAIKTIIAELTNRVNGCIYLSNEIAAGQYSLDVIQKAEGEIRKTRMFLQPKCRLSK